MMNLEALKGELARDEGVELRMYLDTSTPPNHTIGVGHNLDAVPISYEAAMQILEDDILAVMGELNLRLPWWNTLDDVRQRVLANMCFNLGIEDLMLFTTFLPLMEKGDYGAAADDLANTKIAKDEPKRIARLISMIRTGTV